MQHMSNQKTKKLLNSIVEVNIDGKLSLVSLYDDLPHFEYDLTIDNLKNSNTKLKTCIRELKQYITKLENENSHLKTNNAVIQKNITSLYKTASKEIQRKDNIINELRKSQLYAQPEIVSKMFSGNDNQNKHDPALELKIKTDQKQMELNNISKMNVQPDKNIPKTVYYKRLCDKFAMENKTNEFKNKKPEEIDKIIIDKKTSALDLETETHAKQTTEDINNSSKPADQIKNKDLTANAFTDKNIMNTVHCKPLCQKFDKENETIQFENKKPEEIDNIITDKKNKDLNLRLNIYQKQIEVINNSDKPDNLNEINDDFTTNIQPNKNIPKTVCYQSLCQKLDKENETIEVENNNIEFENKKLEEIDEIITNKITEDKNEELNNVNKSIHQYDSIPDKSSETSLNTREINQLPVHFEVEHGTLFRNSRKRKVIMLSTSDDNKPIKRKGRRVKLITIKNNYSQPIPSFNGAKKTEIDFSKKSIHIEKVVESSSLFYIPQVKKRRTMNFGDCNS